MILKEINLEIGLAIQMECPVVPDKKKLQSVVRGWRDDEFILTDIPGHYTSNTIANFLRATWVIRYLHHGKIFGFKVKGKDVIASDRLFLLEYPLFAETHSLRKQQRANVNIPVVIHAGSSQRSNGKYTGMSLNISLGGIRIRVAGELNQSKPCFISFYLPGSETFVAFKDLECEVKQIDHRDDVYEIGLKFVNLNEKNEKSIESFINFSSAVGLNQALLPDEK